MKAPNYQILIDTLTMVIGLLSIVANIWITRYNAGKNRKIYEALSIDTGSIESVNSKLKHGDYTILYVGAGEQISNTRYILGRVTKKISVQ